MIKPEIVQLIVAMTAPINPPIFKPTKLEELIASGPGVNCEIVIMSVYSLSVSQWYWLTSKSSIKVMIAYPPPILNVPILKKFMAKLSKISIIYGLSFLIK